MLLLRFQIVFLTFCRHRTENPGLAKFFSHCSGSTNSLRVLVGFVCWLSTIFTSTNATAGIGPENVVVVVNADSEDSRTIANHYANLRHIPSKNVIYLTNVPHEMTTTLADFRERILKPLLQEIDSRGISSHVRAIAYSCHFPYAISIREHRDRLTDENMRKVFTPSASINGLTYLFRFIIADKEQYLSTSPNHYSRKPWERHFLNPFFNAVDAESFTKAVQALDAKEFDTASKALIELFEKHPGQAPLGILAARALVGSATSNTEEHDAEKLTAAMVQLGRAEAAGWSSGRALEEDPALRPLSDRTDFQEMITRLGDAPTITQHPLAFDSTRSWTANGWWTRPDLDGMSYLPACMLAVTRGGGTSVDEAIGYLRRSATADNTFPQGTFYFTGTSDVRSKTRANGTIEALAYLRWLGHDVELIKDKIPVTKPDVLGVTFGTAAYDWPASGSSFVPGAIGDNLTSNSGKMTGSKQTLCTELLKAGAAMASGTVTEPFALQWKFPLPNIHAYYAEGLSAIEAYYASVESPYQLLVVGDPLCQPFARQPAEVVAVQQANTPAGKALLIKTVLPENVNKESVDSKQSSPLSRVEFYVDGKLVQVAVPRDLYTMRLAGLGDGAHEFRIVLVGEPRIAPSKTVVTWFEQESLLPIPEISSIQESGTGANRQVSLTVSSEGADSVRFDHFDQTIATTTDVEKASMTISLANLGGGPIRLQPVASYRGTEVRGAEFIVGND